MCVTRNESRGGDRPRGRVGFQIARIGLRSRRRSQAADAYQLAIDVDGAGLTQNISTAPAAADQTQGAVAYAKDASSSGFVDVYYYLTNI